MTLQSLRQVERKFSAQELELGRVRKELRLLRERISSVAGASSPSTAFSAPSLSGTLVAGQGLTGGGTLPGTVTFNVGAGDGIDVSADAVAVDVTDIIDTSYGLTEDSNNIRVNLASPSGLEFSGGALQVADSIAGAGIAISSKVLEVDLASDSGMTFDTLKLTLGTPTTLSVSTTNLVSTTTHSHDVTTSSNPGAAATILQSDASGHLQLVRLGAGVTPSYPLHAASAAGAQMRLDYGGGNYMDFIIDASGIGGLWPTGDEIRIYYDSDDYIRMIVNSDGSLDLAPESSGSLTPALGIYYDGANYAELEIESDGDLIIRPTGDLIMDPDGTQVLSPSDVAYQSDTYVSQTTGWRITGIGEGDFRYIYADELHAKAFIADLEVALAGGQIICKSVSILSSDFTLPSSGNTDTFTVDDLPSATGMQVFEAGDWIGFRQFSRAGGSLTIAWAWGTVSNPSDNLDGTQDWDFTRDATTPGSASGTISADSIVLDFGTSGYGYYEVNAIDGLYGLNSPYAQTVKWTTHPYTGRVVRTRMGNLRGITSTADEFGLFAGEGVTTTDQYIIISDQSAELHNLELNLYSGSDLRIHMDPTATGANALMWAGPSSSGKQFQVNGNGEVWVSTLAIAPDLGALLFSSASGCMILRGDQVSTDGTDWWLEGTRGERCTIAGAVHLESGRWTGTKGIFVEETTTSLIDNPSFEVNITDFWTRSGYCTTSRVAGGIYGSYCLKMVKTSAGGGSSAYVATASGTGSIDIDPSTDYAFSAYCKSDADGSVYMTIRWCDSGGSQISDDTVSVAENGQWQRITGVFTSPATAQYVEILLVIQGAASVNSEAYWDAIQVEEKSYVTSYADGSLGEDYSWSGTAHNSTSTRTATTISLDDYVELVNGDNTVSIRAVVQAQYDSTDVWNGDTAAWLWDWSVGAATDRISFQYLFASDVFRVTITNSSSSETMDSSAVTFSKGDWLDLVVTFDLGNGDAWIYLDGVQIGEKTNFTNDNSFAATDWSIGEPGFASGYYGQWLFGEYSVFKSTLSEEEVAGIYALQRPLIDTGALEPGTLTILDGRFRVMSSVTGNRIEITPEEIAGYDDSDVKQFYLQASDGKAYAGGGAVIIDATSGIEITPTGSYANARGYTFSDGSGLFGKSGVAFDTVKLLSEATTGYDSGLLVHAEGPSGYGAEVNIRANSVSANYCLLQLISDPDQNSGDPFANFEGDYLALLSTADLRVGGGLYVGATNVDPDTDDVWCDGEISTDGGTTRWDLGGYSAGAPTADGYVTLYINGSTYEVLVNAV
jgi:hypothetical protein